LFGAACPARGIGAALVLPSVNIEAMNLHLAEIGKHVEPGSHAVVVLDGAGWHQPGDRLHIPDNQPAPPAALLAAAQSGRKYLAIPATKLPRPPRAQHLRRDRPSLLRRLECSHLHTRQDQINCFQVMGTGHWLVALV